MLLSIPGLLGVEQVSALRSLIESADWEDGNATAGQQARMVKNNRQLSEDSDAAQKAGQIVLAALSSNPLFVTAALPDRIYPPMFNSYSGGETYGLHVDNAVRIQPGSNWRVRSDLSMTVFLEDPAQYDGGELTIETHFGVQSVKLAAGDGILYPSSSLHMVQPVTRGRRLASFFWIQSLVRDDAARTSLFDLDQSIQTLAGKVGLDDPSIVRLTGVYHNLLRQWAAG